MPGEGHGVLIARKWVIPAAQAAPMDGMDAEVAIDGAAYKVARVLVHPGYKRTSDASGQETLKSGDPPKIRAFLAGSDDIALIELGAPVEQAQSRSMVRAENTQTYRAHAQALQVDAAGCLHMRHHASAHDRNL
ncbi:hypothetical protein XarjCFBP7645_06490 [Xanthomonas arboricola]|uniref:Uncharacterized protein n=2 Tax=Xanthomonas arboricola TaxID=56448 RepID=A0A2S7AJ02_9XANT|nr:hypothetical protein XarjCFBP7645_06490 [Xanthomonas arboricola]